MSAIDSLNRFLYVVIDTLRQASRIRVWLILLPYLIVNQLVLYAHYDFLSPYFHEIVMEWIGLVDQVSSWVSGVEIDNSSKFTHYPAHLFLLPEYFRWAKLAIALVFESLVLGALARTFGRRFMWQNEYNPPGRSFLSAWPNILIIWILTNGLILGAGHYLPIWLQPFLSEPPRILAFTVIVMPALFILILAVLFFAIPSVAVLGDGFYKGLQRSIRCFIDNPFRCLILSAMVLILPLLCSVFREIVAEVVGEYDPVLIVWVLSVQLVAETVTIFLWMGTGVKYLSLRRSW